MTSWGETQPAAMAPGKADGSRAWVVISLLCCHGVFRGNGSKWCWLKMVHVSEGLARWMNNYLWLSLKSQWCFVMVALKDLTRSNKQLDVAMARLGYRFLGCDVAMKGTMPRNRKSSGPVRSTMNWLGAEIWYHKMFYIEMKGLRCYFFAFGMQTSFQAH